MTDVIFCECGRIPGCRACTRCQSSEATTLRWGGGRNLGERWQRPRPEQQQKNEVCALGMFDPKYARTDIIFVSCSAFHIYSHEETKSEPRVSCPDSVLRETWTPALKTLRPHLPAHTRDSESFLEHWHVPSLSVHPVLSREDSENSQPRWCGGWLASKEHRLWVLWASIQLLLG